MKDHSLLEYNEKDKIPCPHCNNTIPRASEYCPFCGVYLKDLERVPAYEKPKKLVRRSKKRGRVSLEDKKEEDSAMIGTILIMMIFEIILFYIVKII